MNDLRQAAQQVLEALTPFVRGNWTPGLAAQAAAAMACLEAALAEPLYLVSREVKSEQRPVGTTHKSVKGGVVWNRWPDEMEDGTHLYVNPPPCQTCEALARTVMMDQVGKA